MEHKTKGKFHSLNDEVQITKGESFFRNVQISWRLSDDYGLTVSRLRCGICLAPLESHAVKLAGDEIFLICEEGHLIGHELIAEEGQDAQPQVKAKKGIYSKEIETLLAEFMAGRKTIKEMQQWQNLPRIAKLHEYNLTLEALINSFRDSYFHQLEG